MTPAQLIVLAIQVSADLIVTSVALNARFSDLASLWQQPGLLARSLLSMYVVMPTLAVCVAPFLHLNPVVEIALIALAIAPVPPLLPRRQIHRSGGARSYTAGLLTATVLVSMV
jgi:BASS family bile acid:Na+ symporter